MTLLDGEDNELATSARPAMLPHTSALRKGIGMLFSWPLHVAGLRREAETVLVDCVDFYEVWAWGMGLGLGSGSGWVLISFFKNTSAVQV